MPYNAIRTHDSIYLHEDRYETPKEYFKFIDTFFMKQIIDSPSPLSIMDVGCATGEFLYYMNAVHSDICCTGLDILPELLEKAKQRIPSSSFLHGDISSRGTLPEKQYDAVFLLGVLGIFNNIDPVFENLIRLCKKGGKIYLFALINSDPVDVYIKAKRVDISIEHQNLEVGWNVFSIMTIKKILLSLAPDARASFHDFQLPVDIEKQADPFRTWTFRNDDGTRSIVNATCVLHTLKLSVISL